MHICQKWGYKILLYHIQDLAIHLFFDSPCIYLFMILNLTLFFFSSAWCYENFVQQRTLKRAQVGLQREIIVVGEGGAAWLKGLFAKNERGDRLSAIKKRFWSLLILLLSVASIKRKLIKTSHTKERSAHTNWGRWNIRLRP